MTDIIYLVEFTAIVDSTGTSQIFRFSTASDFMTQPHENPPNTPYLPFVSSPGQYERHCWSQGSTRGTSSRGFGSIKFVNDGTFDPIMNYGLDGQPIQVLFGPKNGAYPADFTILLTGVCRRPNFPSRTEFDVVIVDRQGDAADFTFQPTKYAGTNSGAVGLEGLPADIQGKPKPKLRGRCYNVPAIQVNSSNLDYQVDDGSAIYPAAGVFVDAVYDKRSALTLKATYTAGNLTAYMADFPSIGYYTTYCGPEGWYFRIGETPKGIITSDVHEGAAKDRTIAQIVSRVASSEGKLPLADMVGVAALDAAKPYEVGIWVGAESTVGQVIDAVLDSGNAYMTDSRAGKINFGYLQDPVDMKSVATIEDWMIKDEENGFTVTGTNDSGIGIRLSTNWDGTAQRYASNQDATIGLPTWRILLLYQKNFQVMSNTDLAGDAAADIAFARLEYRTYAVSDATVLVQHRKAPEFTATTLITNLADATIEAKSQLGMRKIPRYVYVIPVATDQVDDYGVPLASTIDLGVAFTLVSSRYGFQAGKKLLCIGLSGDFGATTSQSLTNIYAWG